MSRITVREQLSGGRGRAFESHHSDQFLRYAADRAGYDGRIIARFLSKIDLGGPDDCWLWRGSVNAKGYGRFKIFGQLESPHVLAYVLANGLLPPGGGYHRTVVRHSCDNPRCVNPKHLLAGTQAQNVEDMIARGRQGSRPSLSQETIDAIRASDEPLAAIVAKHGVTIHQVKGYRRSSYGAAQKRIAELRGRSGT